MAKPLRLATLRYEGPLWDALPPGEARRERVLTHVAERLDALRGRGLDLVVLSEAVEALGQTVALAETLDAPGPFLTLYRDWARREGCHVAGSLKLRVGAAVYNAVVIVGADGAVLGYYAKANLTLSELQEGLTPGPGATVIDTPIGRIGGVICFDLNFAWLREQYRALKPDLLVFPSMYHGGLMQGMWAYDCRCYFAAALYFDGCDIRDPLGEMVATTHCYADAAIATIELDRAVLHLDYNRVKFPDLHQRYGDAVDLRTPANLGSVLLLNHLTDRTAADLVAEFGFQELDDYFAASRRANVDAVAKG